MSKLTKEQRDIFEYVIVDDGVYEAVNNKMEEIMEEIGVALTDNQFICWEIKVKRTIGECE